MSDTFDHDPEPIAFRPYVHTVEGHVVVSTPLYEDMQRVRDLLPIMTTDKGIIEFFRYDPNAPHKPLVPPSRWKRWRERKAIRWWLVEHFLPEAINRYDDWDD